jgi:O-antigen ligase
MVARRLRLPASGGELLIAATASGATALLLLVALSKLGSVGLLAPLLLVLGVVLIARPFLAVGLLVALTIFCEGPTFGLFSFTSNIYGTIYHDITLLDVFVVLAVFSVGLDMVRQGRSLWVPRPLALPLTVLALAMIAGVVTGRASGASLRFALTSEHILAYLLTLPLAVANLDLDRAQLMRLMRVLFVVATVKALFGLIEVLGHFGVPVEGATTLTYYEPASNWLIMVALLGVFAMVLARARPPVWALLASPALIACLVLSYRRSFWIGAVLGLLLLLLLGTTPTGRRMLVPAGLGLAVAVWLLGSIHFQTQLPVVKRVASLSPSKLEANAQDRYRLDERANVLGEIRSHPITGLGVTIPWAADVQPLSIEHEEGRQYVHFAALWFWLKLGILGLFSYIAVILGSMACAWQAWRNSSEPLLRAFGVASLCGMAGLLAIDTTASFTGVDARLTVLIAAQVGLLALAVRTSASPSPPDAEMAAVDDGPPSLAPSGRGSSAPAWS